MKSVLTSQPRYALEMMCFFFTFFSELLFLVIWKEWKYVLSSQTWHLVTLCKWLLRCRCICKSVICFAAVHISGNHFWSNLSCISNFFCRCPLHRREDLQANQELKRPAGMCSPVYFFVVCGCWLLPANHDTYTSILLPTLHSYQCTLLSI